jgi:hypothetical protein
MTCHRYCVGFQTLHRRNKTAELLHVTVKGLFVCYSILITAFQKRAMDSPATRMVLLPIAEIIYCRRPSATLPTAVNHIADNRQQPCRRPSAMKNNA